MQTHNTKSYRLHPLTICHKHSVQHRCLATTGEHTNTHIHTQTHTYTHKYTHKHTHTQTNTHIYTHANTHIHTHCRQQFKCTKPLTVCHWPKISLMAATNSIHHYITCAGDDSKDLNRLCSIATQHNKRQARTVRRLLLATNMAHTSEQC